MTTPMDAVGVVESLGGIARAGDIERASSRRALARAHREGLLVRISRGRYALPMADEASRAAAALNGVASHLSAAAYWGWEMCAPPDLPQVCVGRGRNIDVATRRAVVVRWRGVGDEDQRRGVTGPLRTVLDCARDLPFEDALAVADSALRHRDVSPEELRDAASTGRGPRSARARRVAEAADARSWNAFESVVRAMALEAGLDVAPQQPIPLADATIHPDLLDRSRRLVIEADSWTYHAEKSAFSRDIVRYNALTLAGWRLLRFTWDQVRQRPAYVRAVLRRAAEAYEPTTTASA